MLKLRLRPKLKLKLGSQVINAKLSMLKFSVDTPSYLYRGLVKYTGKYRKNWNIIHTIFTNNRGPVRIIHINLKKHNFPKKTVTLHKYLYQAICTRLFSNSHYIIKLTCIKNLGKFLHLGLPRNWAEYATGHLFCSQIQHNKH